MRRRSIVVLNLEGGKIATYDYTINVIPIVIEGEGVAAMRTHTKLVAAVAGLAGALLLPALATAAPTPLVAPALSGVAALPGPIAPAAKTAATMTTLTDEARRRGRRHEVHPHRQRTAREQGRLDRLGHGQRDVGRRRPPRQRRLPRPLGLEDPGRARPGTDRRPGQAVREADGAPGLRRRPRHLRGRRRRPGREGRLPDRPLRHDQPEAGPDRHDDHASPTTGSARRCTRAARRSSTTTTTSAR